MEKGMTVFEQEQENCTPKKGDGCTKRTLKKKRRKAKPGL